jgi:hypothetical protein
MIGYLMLVTIQNEEKTGPRCAAIYFATCGIFSALALNITWLLNNQVSHSKKVLGLVFWLRLGNAHRSSVALCFHLRIGKSKIITLLQ